METQLLRNPEVFPSNEVLKDSLGNAYEVFKYFMDTIINSEYVLTPEWNYYRDGKAWLCKVIFKKKTVFWLSVWEEYFKISFFFTQKYLDGITMLDISEEIKEYLNNSNSFGRLIPLIINIDKKDNIPDILTIIKYKKSLK